MVIALLIAIAMWIVFGLLGGWISGEKGRDNMEGFLLGLFLGPFGVLIAALMPTKQADGTKSTSPVIYTSTPELIEQDRKWHEQQQARLLLVAQLAREDQKKRQEAERRDRERLHAEAERRWEENQKRAREGREWIEREILRFGWYKRLPDLAQAIVLGLSFALPAVVVLAILFRSI